MSILFQNGDFFGVVALARRLRQYHPLLAPRDISEKEKHNSSSLVNGVHMTVIGLSFWPAALACLRAPREISESALEEVLAAAESYHHPPTCAYALANLSINYFRVICDATRGTIAADQSEELAVTHGLLHCSRFLCVIPPCETARAPRSKSHL